MEFGGLGTGSKSLSKAVATFVNASGKLAYSEDAILLGKLTVPDMYFIKKFALHGTCSGLNGLVRIMFDVPYVDGKDMHNVVINLFDVSGRLVHQIAAGQYFAGHYTIV